MVLTISSPTSKSTLPCRLTCTSAEARLQGREKIRDAFRQLAGTDESDKAFVEAHKWFGTKFWRYVADGINTNRVQSKAVAKPRPTEWTPEANEVLLRMMKEIKESVRIA